MKSALRKIIPKSLVSGLERFYRYFRGMAFYIAYGMPGRKLKIIGITGTNGKTTTATIVNEVLKQAGYKTALKTTVNDEILGKYEKNKSHLTSGTTKEVMSFVKRVSKTDAEWLVLEVTSQALEQHRYWGFKFEAAVMTNLTYEHMEYHKTMDAYAKAKSMLFKKKPPVIVLNSDDEWFEYFNKFPASTKKLIYGKSRKKANFLMTSVKSHLKGNDVKIKVDKDSLDLKNQLVGKFNAYNMTAAAAVCYGLGVDAKQIEKGVAAAKWVDGRMNVVDEGQKFAVFTDYAHTPDGLTQVLVTLKEMTEGKVILVQSAMDGRDPAKRPKMGEVSAQYADSIYVCDEEAFELQPEVMRQDIIRGIKKMGGEKKYTEIADRQEAIDAAIAEAKPEDTVLIIPFGHQTTMTFFDKTIHWDDREAAAKAIKKAKGK